MYLFCCLLYLGYFDSYISVVYCNGLFFISLFLQSHLLVLGFGHSLAEYSSHTMVTPLQCVLC